MNYNWKIEKLTSEQQALRDSLSAELHISPMAAALLVRRGITTRTEASAFVHPDLSQLHDPFLMLGMREAEQRLSRAIDSGEKILIYGDYDVDGTIAGTHPAKDLEIYLDTDEETEIEQKSSSDLKITLVSGTTYRYQLTFVGDDDNNYKLDVTLETEAYDGTNDYAEITLNETPEEGSAVENTTLSTQPVKALPHIQ